MEEIKIKQLKKITPKIVEEIKELIFQLSQNTEVEEVPIWLNKILKTKTADLIVALNREDKIIGMVMLFSYPVIEGFNKGWIEAMVVNENFRKMGIGEKLIRRVLKIAKKKGLKKVNLTSKPERIAANKFYQKIGFLKIETNVYRLGV